MAGNHTRLLTCVVGWGDRHNARALVPVAVRIPPGGADKALVLITASGVRLEGLGVEEAAWLLRELS